MNNNPRLPARATAVFHRPTIGTGPSVTVDILLTVTSVTIGGNNTGTAGDVLVLNVLALMSNGETRIPQEIPNVTFIWASSNTNLATVDQSGNATLVAAGVVDILCTAEGVTGTLRITISALAPVLTTILVTMNTQLLVGTTETATAEGFDANGNTFATTFTWTSTVTGVATVGSSTGIVTPVAPGQTQIRATSGSIVGVKDITVTSPVPTLVSLAVSPSGSTIATSSTQTFTVLGTYSNGSTGVPTGVVWSETGGGSINSSSGVYTAGGSPETATIFATVGSVVGQTTVAVAAAGGQPSYYDPARLGSDKILGTNWAPLTIGASLAVNQAAWAAEGQVGMGCYPAGGGSNYGGQNLVEGQVLCIANGAFGKVVRIVIPFGSNHTVVPMAGNVEIRASIPAASGVTDFFYRSTMRWVGNGNIQGGPPSGGYPTGNYPNGYYSSYGTAGGGGSPTHKFMFAFPTDANSRMEFVLQNPGYCVLGAQNGDAVLGSVLTTWTQHGTENPSVDSLIGPVAGGANFPYFNAEAACKWRADNEFYEVIGRYKSVGTNSYIQAYYFRSCTTLSGTSLAATPGQWRFKGFTITNGVPKPYNAWQAIGNKSQVNNGPNDMFIDVAAFEIVKGTTTAEPYATLASYGSHP